MGNHAVIIERQIESALNNLRFKSLVVRIGNKSFHYICNTCEYNHYLNRYYPKATLIMTCEHLK